MTTMTNTTGSFSLPVWRTALKKALDANASLPNAKYFQIASATTSFSYTTNNTNNNGSDDSHIFPSVRTVVFRGFLDRDPDKVTFVTDKRSEKVREFAFNNKTEICWYFPNTREQFRLRGVAHVVTNESTDEIDVKDRSNSWKKLRPGPRGQFAWPNPGQVRLPEHEEVYTVDRLLEDEDANETAWPKEKVLENFCLVTVDVIRVDHLKLKANKRYVYKRSLLGKKREKDGEWVDAWENAIEVCP